MKNLLKTILICLLFSACHTGQKATSITSTTSKKSTNKKQVYLFAGQSNMDGRANGADLSEKDLERLAKVANRIQFYYNSKPVTPLQLSTPAKHTQRKFSLTQSFGPELFFGIELAEKYPKKEFIFIKRAKGGTSLYGCWNPDWTEEKAAHMKELKKPKLFHEFIALVQNTLAQYKPNEYEIKGMLWVQGESDSGVKKRGEAPSNSYGANLQNLIKQSREKLGVPDMPFVLFQVGSGKVVKGMKETAAADDRVYMIPQSKDKDSGDFYAKNPPPIGHYTAGSMKRIGGEFFRVFEAIYGYVYVD